MMNNMPKSFLFIYRKKIVEDNLPECTPDKSDDCRYEINCHENIFGYIDID